MNQDEINIALAKGIEELWVALNTTMDIIGTVNSRTMEIAEVLSENAQQNTIMHLATVHLLRKNGLLGSRAEWMEAVNIATHNLDQYMAALGEETNDYT